MSKLHPIGKQSWRFVQRSQNSVSSIEQLSLQNSSPSENEFLHQLTVFAAPLSFILKSTLGPGTVFLLPLFLLPSVVELVLQSHFELCVFGLITRKCQQESRGQKPNNMQIYFGNFSLFKLGINQPINCGCRMSVCFSLRNFYTLKCISHAFLSFQFCY